MNLDDAFKRCLAGLHEAALDDGARHRAATLIAEACGSKGHALAVGERTTGEGIHIDFMDCVAGSDPRPDIGRKYIQIYNDQDIGMRRFRKLPTGQMTHVRSLYTAKERRTSPTFNEMWRPAHADNGLVVCLDDRDRWRATWALGSPVDDDWDSAKVRLFEALIPHTRQFVRVRQSLAEADALGAGLAGLLDNGRIGVVQIDRRGQVVAVNAPALAILRRGDGLIDRDGALDAWLPADRSRLRRLVGRALPVAASDAPPSSGSMTVQRASGRSRLGVHVTPVGDPAADFGGRRVAALVLVVDPAHRPRIDAARVEKTLGLTRSEARLAALLTEGLRVREIAAAAGWRENYVRWLVRQLGASGQVDVARQVLAVDALPQR
ncbi:MAG: hypothetical protein F4X81_10195 [Gammaproteobacteria bacterium]|nr:hypothetical protein [Gammaproteobacteria bacterium]